MSIQETGKYIYFFSFENSTVISIPLYLLIGLVPHPVPYYLSPAAEGRGWEIIKRLPYVCAYIHVSVRRSSRFCINLNISFIYGDIFTKFAGNVYGYENLSLKKFNLILKNKMAAIANCLKIVKVL